MEPARIPVEEILIEVFREQRSRLWGFLSRRLSSGPAAEDLLQETFLRAWDHRDALGLEAGPDAREAARRYLWRVARNLIVDEVRLRYRKGDRGSTLADGPDEDPGPAATVELEECVRVIRETVGRLPNEQGRRCLELWMEEKELTDIAREVNLGVNQVRGLLQRARAELIERAANRFRIRTVGPRKGEGGSR